MTMKYDFNAQINVNMSNEKRTDIELLGNKIACVTPCLFLPNSRTCCRAIIFKRSLTWTDWTVAVFQVQWKQLQITVLCTHGGLVMTSLCWSAQMAFPQPERYHVTPHWNRYSVSATYVQCFRPVHST